LHREELMNKDESRRKKLVLAARSKIRNPNMTVLCINNITVINVP
jgi:hypothetical protein